MRVDKTESIIRVTELNKSFQNARDNLSVLRDISFSAHKGEVIGLVGPSGAGKTSLLRIIAGLLQADSGEVLIENMPPATYRADKGIGFVFQKPYLFPWRSLYKNLMMPIEMRKGQHIEDPDARIEKLLALFGLLEFKNYYPYQLSGGMQQRATVARALMLNPQVLLLDEAFNALDELTREQIWLDFRKIWKAEGLTTLLITHSIREAVFLSDKVFVMSKIPSTIIFECDLTDILPEERTFDLFHLPAFHAANEQVRKHLFSETN
ncbi:MAG: ABC transporter ATP-binding protein [Bacteroidota bacterium]